MHEHTGWHGGEVDGITRPTMLSILHLCTHTTQVEIDTVEKYEELRKQEQKYFTDMVQLCKDSGAGLVICQWGFDDEANSLLMHHNLPAVRWVCLGPVGTSCMLGCMAASRRGGSTAQQHVGVWVLAQGQSTNDPLGLTHL